MEDSPQSGEKHTLGGQEKFQEINIRPSSSKPESTEFTLHGKGPKTELMRLERRF
ncbi:sperm-associated antigen 17 isoform X1 [Prionailurus iriomotensis]